MNKPLRFLLLAAAATFAFSGCASLDGLGLGDDDTSDDGIAATADVLPHVVDAVSGRAEVYVDGFYAGRVDDFDGARQKLSITRGAHQIELRLAGYETTTFNVTIVVGETTTYKTSLKKN